MTKAQKAEKAEAIAQLREWIKPGDTVYTILDHVSRSGMSRQIRVVLLACEDGRPTDLHPNWAVGKALGLSHGKRNGRELDSLTVGGCGMDMGFHLVYSLSSVLYGDGYQCLGKGKCPSNYHVNHRDRIRCPGVSIPTRSHECPEAHCWDAPVALSEHTANLSGEASQYCPKCQKRASYSSEVFEADRFCWKPDRYSSRFPVPDDWPYAEETITVDGDDGQPLSHTYKRLLSCLSTGDDSIGPVCPTCKGVGDLPNPDGPERFDLLHTDGYALRHRWL